MFGGAQIFDSHHRTYHGCGKSVDTLCNVLFITMVVCLKKRAHKNKWTTHSRMRLWNVDLSIRILEKYRLSISVRRCQGAIHNDTDWLSSVGVRIRLNPGGVWEKTISFFSIFQEPYEIFCGMLRSNEFTIVSLLYDLKNCSLKKF